MQWMHIGTIRESGTWASACVTRWLYWDRTIAIIVIIIIAIILPYHHQHHHPPAILGQNNRNNCDYYHRNYLALPSSTSSPTGYIGTEQSQLSQQSCFIIIVIIIWLHWEGTITIITIILPYHHLFSIIIRQ